VAALVEGVRATDGAAVVGPLRRGTSDVRWVRLDALHVTVRFLGPATDEQVPALASVVERVASATRPFAVELSGAGAFPDPQRPRVLWLGLATGAAGLARLAEATNEAIAPLGWTSDGRPFRAHLTLARSDGVRAGPRLAQRLIDASHGLSIPWRAERLVLFESVTGGGPARYLPLAEAAFETEP
jgi:2'-5' RNA ligase